MWTFKCLNAYQSIDLNRIHVQMMYTAFYIFVLPGSSDRLWRLVGDDGSLCQNWPRHVSVVVEQDNTAPNSSVQASTVNYNWRHGLMDDIQVGCSWRTENPAGIWDSSEPPRGCDSLLNEPSQSLLPTLLSTLDFLLWGCDCEVSSFHYEFLIVDYFTLYRYEDINISVTIYNWCKRWLIALFNPEH